ncbi:septum formation inhibitor Maf [Parashewanella spongiae]|uniref:7-methyl-GTP pyrophosphatase n=1 Tax=Parashewanella spongiae TaxID=342950 RepID=A0A3A6TRC8_9GAMM|nr:nucleoside triphosphate pyrophosphatase [Parashewanella spongiae]MCL1077486.1 Maf family nucleotide pyrophosphatase [Parashewanella spongiae]RJY18657.1 septum formation inhibitor Maf [Parashewanella spongiae]
MKKLVLASCSPFRQELLKKLQIPFDSVSPKLDESPNKNETAIELVERLAIQKAKAGAAHIKDSEILIIGSDQVAVIDGKIIGKPLTEEKAVMQLKSASGKSITFYTGLCVLDKKTFKITSSVEPFTVHFRVLNDHQIKSYVEKEQPLWCAGSFKCEGLGIALFEKLEGNDPNTLIGLPLIRLVDMLKQHGLDIL